MISGRLAGHRWQRNVKRIKAPGFPPNVTSKVIHLLDFGAMLTWYPALRSEHFQEGQRQSSRLITPVGIEFTWLRPLLGKRRVVAYSSHVCLLIIAYPSRMPSLGRMEATNGPAQCA
jgi:hypothetical protein